MVNGQLLIHWFMSRAKSIVGSGNPSGTTALLMQNHTQPSDNKRVARPIYPLPEFK